MLPSSIKHYKSKVQTRCLDKYDHTVSDWYLQQKNINNILKRPNTEMTLMNAGKYYNTKKQIIRLLNHNDEHSNPHYDKTCGFLRQYRKTTSLNNGFSHALSGSRKAHKTGFFYTDKSSSNQKIIDKPKVLNVYDFPVTTYST